jgi:hypothetical protein
VRDLELAALADEFARRQAAEERQRQFKAAREEYAAAKKAHQGGPGLGP